MQSPEHANAVRDDVQAGSRSEQDARNDVELADSGGDPDARDDELLADPPRDGYHFGRLDGYREGARSRRYLHGAIVFSLVGSVVAGYLYVRHLQESRGYAFFRLPEGTDFSDRSRVMEWSTGRARLGLHREPPGVDTILLPDRVLRLADGCDQAQIRVEVHDGRTTSLVFLTGEVTQEPRMGDDER